MPKRYNKNEKKYIGKDKFEKTVHGIKSANVKSDYSLIIFQTGYWHINSLIGRINDKALCEFLKVFKVFLSMQLLQEDSEAFPIHSVMSPKIQCFF